CLKIVRCVAFYVRCSTLARFNFIAKLAQFIGQMGLVNSGSKLLALKQGVRLQRPHLAIVALSHIEDDDMRVELRRGVAVYGPRRVMLELSCCKLASCLGGIISADAGLRVPLPLLQCPIHGLAMRFTHAAIATDKGGQRDGLRRGKS